MYLKELASQLYIIHRTDKPVGSEESIDLLLQNKDNNNNNNKIYFISNSIVKAINGNSKVESLTLSDSKIKSESNLDVDGIFVEMGYVARTDIVKDLVQLNGNKEIIVDKYCSTSTKGIFASRRRYRCTLQTGYNFCRSRSYCEHYLHIITFNG